MRDHETADIGDVNLDLSAVEQICEKSQTRAIVDGIRYPSSQSVRLNCVKSWSKSRWIRQHVLDKSSVRVAQCVEALEEAWDEHGLDALSDRSLGDYARPRKYEVAAALNRLRFLRCNHA